MTVTVTVAEARAQLRQAETDEKSAEQKQRLEQLHKLRSDIRSLSIKVRRLVAEVQRADALRTRIQSQIENINGEIALLHAQAPEFPSPEDKQAVEEGVRRLVAQREALLKERAEGGGPDRSYVLALDRRLTEMRTAERNLVTLLRGDDFGWKGGLSGV